MTNGTEKSSKVNIEPALWVVLLLTLWLCSLWLYINNNHYLHELQRAAQGFKDTVAEETKLARPQHVCWAITEKEEWWFAAVSYLQCSPEHEYHLLHWSLVGEHINKSIFTTYSRLSNEYFSDDHIRLLTDIRLEIKRMRKWTIAANRLVINLKRRENAVTHHNFQPRSRFGSIVAHSVRVIMIPCIVRNSSPTVRDKNEEKTWNCECISLFLFFFLERLEQTRISAL